VGRLCVVGAGRRPAGSVRDATQPRFGLRVDPSVAGPVLAMSACERSFDDPTTAQCSAPPVSLDQLLDLGTHQEVVVHFTCEPQVLIPNLPGAVGHPGALALWHRRSGSPGRPARRPPGRAQSPRQGLHRRHLPRCRPRPTRFPYSIPLPPTRRHRRRSSTGYDKGSDRKPSSVRPSAAPT
jgi:hypothetical protein